MMRCWCFVAAMCWLSLSQAEDGPGTLSIDTQLETARALGQAGLWPQMLDALEDAANVAQPDTPPELLTEIQLLRAAGLQAVERLDDAVALMLPLRDELAGGDQVQLQMRLLMNLSSAYGRAGMYSEGLEVAQEGLALARANNDAERQQRFLLNLSRLYLDQGDTENQARAVEQAASVKRSEPIPDLDSTLLMARVSLAQRKGDHELAVQLSREALATAGDDVYHRAFAARLLATSLCRIGQTDEGIDNYKIALDGFERADSLADMASTANDLSTCLGSAERYAEALEAAQLSRTKLVASQQRRQVQAVAALEAHNRTQRLNAELRRVALDNQTLAAKAATAQAERLHALNLLWAGLAIIMILVFRTLWLSWRRQAQWRLLDQRKAILARTSHEIRNPAQGLVGLLDTLESELTGEQAAKLRAAQAAARLIEALSGHYLQSSRRQSDSEPLDAPQPCHLPSLLAHVLALGKSMPSAYDQTLSLSIDPQLPALVDLNEPTLMQVLLNLVGNARHYAGRTQVQLIARQVDSGSLEIRVEDNGPGLGPDELGRLFEPGFRGEAGRGEASGAGLGLYVVKELASAMGGTLSASNRCEGGASFRLVLPYRQSRQSPTRRQHARRDALSAMTVLLVDDDDLARVGLAAQLKYLGCEVTTAAEIETLAAVLKEHEPQIVLIDGQLKDSSGEALCRAIRAFDQQRGWHRRIFLVSGTLLPATLDKHESCWDGAARKPVSVETLHQLLTDGPAPQADQTGHPPADGPQILRTEALQRLALLAGEHGRLDQRLIADYLACADQRTSELAESILKGEERSIRRLAHCWRSGASMLGLEALSQLLESIEKDPATGPRHLDRLAELSRASKHALIEHRDTENNGHG